MPNIYQVLKELDIPYDRYDHPPVYTVEQADRLRGKMPGGHHPRCEPRGHRSYGPRSTALSDFGFSSQRQLCDPGDPY